jgi:hypothetical protein
LERFGGGRLDGRRNTGDGAECKGQDEGVADHVQIPSVVRAHWQVHLEPGLNAPFI